MKTVIHGADSVIDVNTPGDAHFINCLCSLQPEAPRCAGVKSGKAKIIPVTFDMEFPETGLRGEMTFGRIECADSCPRDIQSMNERCGIGYAD